MTHAPGPAPERLPILDGVRGMAALIVVVAHGAGTGLLPGILAEEFGQIGVGVFYVLSGFLMGHLYLDQPFTHDAVRGYAISRGARVLPLFYATLLLGLVLVIVFGLDAYRFRDLSGFVQNALLLRGSGILWSIPVEIHFYLVFIGLWFAASKGRLIWPILALFALQPILIPLFWGSSGFRIPLAFWMHFFLVGCLMARLYDHRQTTVMALRNHALTPWLGWVTLGLVALAPPMVRHNLGAPALPVFADPFAVGYAIVFVACGLLQAGPFRYFSAGWMRWLGAISFSVYLLHYPVLLVFAGFDTPLTGTRTGDFALATALILALSTASQKWIELPAQAALKTRLRRRTPVRRPTAPQQP